LAVPTDFAGLRAWYKADAITGLLDGDPVASWTDSSGNGFTLSNATTAQRPVYKANMLNGLPIVRFDAVDDGLFTNTALFTASGVPWTVFAVYENNLHTASGRRVANGSTSQAAGNWLVGPHGGLHRVYAGAFTPGQAVTDGKWVRQTGKSDGATVTNYVDGTSMGSVAATGSPPGGFTIGYSANSWMEPADCDVAEVIVYNTQLTAADQTSIEDYLYTRWLKPPFAGVTSYTTTITDDELIAAAAIEGNNLLKVFVKDAAGNWST
jgi:hypothetical protein